MNAIIRDDEPDRLAACAAHALALRAIIRYQRHRGTAVFEGGVNLVGEELPDFAAALPNGFTLGKLYTEFMAEWLPEAYDGSPAAQELYVELASAIIIDEMTGAEGQCGDDLYHVITLLAALKPTISNAAADDFLRAERVKRRSLADDVAEKAPS
jgi:hypothetical protein